MASTIPFPNAWWWRPPTEPLELRRTAIESPTFDHLGADLLKAIRLSGADAYITVSRQSPRDAGFREIFVSIDGERAAILENGQSVTCEIKAGPHRVRAHNTLFWKTHDIVLKPGEHARFVAINRPGWGTFGPLLMLGAVPVYLMFERETESVLTTKSAEIKTGR